MPIKDLLCQITLIQCLPYLRNQIQ